MSISFPSSGDTQTDQQIADRFELHSARMAKNVCPNGCAQMIWIDEYSRECKVCGFQGFSTKPYDMETAQA